MNSEEMFFTTGFHGLRNMKESQKKLSYIIKK